jgi:hypothetical protein
VFLDLFLFICSTYRLVDFLDEFMSSKSKVCTFPWPQRMYIYLQHVSHIFSPTLACVFSRSKSQYYLHIPNLNCRRKFHKEKKFQVEIERETTWPSTRASLPTGHHASPLFWGRVSHSTTSLGVAPHRRLRHPSCPLKTLASSDHHHLSPMVRVRLPKHPPTP